MVLEFLAVVNEFWQNVESLNTLIELAYSVGLILLLFWISFVDLKLREISSGPIYALVFLAFLGALEAGLNDFAIRAISALSTTGVLWALSEVYFRHTFREGLGIGDVKLYGASVFLLGPISIPSLFFLSSLGGIVAVLTMRVWRREPVDGIPFAPFISYAVIVIYFFGPIPF